MIPELAERGAHVKALLHSPGTAFLLVTSLEREPVAETIYFHERMREAGLPFAALVVNRVREPVGDDPEPLDLEPALLAKVQASAAEAALLAARDAEGLERLRGALGDPVVVTVPQIPATSTTPTASPALGRLPLRLEVDGARERERRRRLAALVVRRTRVCSR